MIRSLLGGAVAFFALACAMILATPAEARHEYQAFGGRGDASVVIECPAGETLAGLQGRAGSWINAMQILCAPLTGSASVGAAHPVGNYFGGRPGGEQFQATCPGDSVATGINFNLTDDKAEVAAIGLYCNRGDGTQVNPIFQGRYPDAENRCAKFLGIIPQGCDPGVGDRNQTCAQEYLVGLTVHSGRDVNAVGAICDRRAPPAPPPPPAAAKPIKTTGRARVPAPAPAAPTGPPVALRETVSGPWSVVLKNGSRYLFLIAAQRGLDPFGHDTMPIAVSGTAMAPGGVTGAFGGSMDVSRQLVVQYGLPNGAAGTCALAYTPDAQRLLGTCTENGTSLAASGARASETEVAVFQNAAPGAVAAPAAAAPAPEAAVAQVGGAQAVTVAQSVDLYPAAGGDGDPTGSLDAGTAGVTLVEPCKDGWCHVKWPGHEGWVYNADDYRSLRF